MNTNKIPPVVTLQIKQFIENAVWTEFTRTCDPGWYNFFRSLNADYFGMAKPPVAEKSQGRRSVVAGKATLDRTIHDVIDRTGALDRAMATQGWDSRHSVRGIVQRAARETLPGQDYETFVGDLYNRLDKAVERWRVWHAGARPCRKRTTR